MFNPHAEPIEHRPVYRRVSINDPMPAEPHEPVGIKSTWQICQELTERREQERIWDLVKQTASGTCAPISSPSSIDLLNDYDASVNTVYPEIP